MEVVVLHTLGPHVVAGSLPVVHILECKLTIATKYLNIMEMGLYVKSKQSDQRGSGEKLGHNAVFG